MNDRAAAPREDFFAMAFALSRGDFASRCQHPFLVVGDPSQAIRLAMPQVVLVRADRLIR